MFIATAADVILRPTVAVQYCCSAKAVNPGQLRCSRRPFAIVGFWANSVTLRFALVRVPVLSSWVRCVLFAISIRLVSSWRRGTFTALIINRGRSLFWSSDSIERGDLSASTHSEDSTRPDSRFSCSIECSQSKHSHVRRAVVLRLSSIVRGRRCRRRFTILRMLSILDLPSVHQQLLNSFASMLFEGKFYFIIEC